MAEVSGREFLGLIKQIKAIGKPGLLDDIIESGGEAVKNVFSRRILAVCWYPYQAYADLIKAMDRKIGKGDMGYCRKLGEIAAELDLGSFLKVYKLTDSGEELLRAASRIWPNYYRNAGRMELVSPQA